MTHMSLGDVAFSASGTGLDGAPARFDFHGRDIGAAHPWIYSAALHPMGLIADHVALGGTLEMGGGLPDATPNAMGILVRPGNSVLMFRLGVEGGGVFAFGPIEVRATVGLGGRIFEVPVGALRPVPCRAGSCAATAWGAQPYIQPRVAIDFVFAHTVAVGAFAAVDVLPSIDDVSFGLFVTGPTPGWHRRARVEGWDDEGPAGEPAATAPPSPPLPPPPPYQGSWRTLDEIEHGDSAVGPVPDIPSVRTP